jgi:hypothetical protein
MTRNKRPFATIVQKVFQTLIAVKNNKLPYGQRSNGQRSTDQLVNWSMADAAQSELGGDALCRFQTHLRYYLPSAPVSQ